MGIESGESFLEHDPMFQAGLKRIPIKALDFQDHQNVKKRPRLDPNYELKPLPEHIKNFLVYGKQTFCHGSKLLKSKDNDLVCKLLFGPLNRSVEVTKKDFQVLEPGVYLNDIMILFYLRFLQYCIIPEGKQRDKIHIFDPQFYTKLSEEPKNSNLNQTKKQGYLGYSVASGY